MYIDFIRRENKNSLIIKIGDIHKYEFAAEFAAEDKKYIEEFSAELIRTIRKKYPDFKKGTIKIVAGTVVIATMQLNGMYLAVNANKGVEITIPVEKTEKFHMSYMYFGNISTQIQNLDNAGSTLNMVSPSYFDLDVDGNLILTKLYNKEFVQKAHSMNMKTVPFLSNHWDRDMGVNALKNREKLSTDIANMIKLYDFDGINVDIENVTHNEKDMYTDFVRLLREKIPAGKEVSVAVAANPKGWTNGWHGSYDYKALSKYSDYLMIMAYDEHYQNGPEGPVASMQFVENSIKYALKHTTADKIVVGIPLFARYWKSGQQGGGYGMSLNTAMNIINNHNSTIHYDNVAKSPMATVIIEENDEKPVVYGRTLAAGTYHIWFEDDTSIREKLLLVGKYGIKGSGSWSLGQEHDGVWDYYEKWGSGVYFNDIASSWARDDIMDAIIAGEMKGVSDVAFEPDRYITRSEFVTLLLRKLNIQVNNNIHTEFNDTVGHWAENEINTAAKAGIILGMGENKFMPDKYVTRQEASSILARVLQLPTGEAGGQFTDVSEANPAKNDIYAVVNVGIFVGYDDGTFKPGRGLKRAETAVIIKRLKKE